MNTTIKGIIKKFIIIGLTLMVIVPLITGRADAASTVSITGDSSAAGGDFLTVTVTYDGDSIGRVSGDITYDTEMLAYVSGGSSSGNVGYVELKKGGTGEPLTFNLKFQALKEGSTELVVSTSEMYDLGEMFLDTPTASKTITITGNADEEEIVQETNPEDNAADENLSVDEKEDTPSEEPVDEEMADDASSDNSGSLAKAIMFGIGGLILILIIAMLLRRKK